MYAFLENKHGVYAKCKKQETSTLYVYISTHVHHMHMASDSFVSTMRNAMVFIGIPRPYHSKRSELTWSSYEILCRTIEFQKGSARVS